MTTKSFIIIITYLFWSISLVFASLSARASPQEDIATIQSKLEASTPPISARSIKPSPIAGLYEVFMDGGIFYVDKDFSHIIVNGNIIETESKKNLTEQSLKKLMTINFNILPLQNAIEIKNGNGEYKFAVFSDPDCPYCRALERGLDRAGIVNYTAYIFLYPLKDLHPDAHSKSESIWCSKNRARSWSNFMLNGIAPEKANCVNPLSAIEKLADVLGVLGTPTIYLNDGQQTQSIEELVIAIKANKQRNEL